VFVGGPIGPGVEERSTVLDEKRGADTLVTGLLVGLVAGIALGVVAWLLTGLPLLIIVGLCLGAGLGIAIGASISWTGDD
jgi:F0F1-type ATP synthase assembly protein I